MIFIKDDIIFRNNTDNFFGNHFMAIDKNMQEYAFFKFNIVLYMDVRRIGCVCLLGAILQIYGASRER